MKRKYLDDIGVTNRPDLWNEEEEDKRQLCWEKEREEYGFDEREIWSLDLTSRLWLYERIKRFKDVASVDLNYHKFIYNRQEHTQSEMLDEILKRLKFSFTKQYDNFNPEHFNYVREVYLMWHKICGAMWW